MKHYTTPELFELGNAADLTKAFIGGTIADNDCMYRDGWG